MKRKLVVAGLAISVAFGASAPFIQPVEHKAYASEVNIAASYQFKQYQQEGLTEINSIRAAIGLQPVTLDPYLVKAAENHSKYLDVNKVTYFYTAFGEQSSNAGFTGGGILDRVKAVGGSGYDSNGKVIFFNESQNLWSDGNIKNDVYKILERQKYFLDDQTIKVGIGHSGDKTVIVAIKGVQPTASKGITYPYRGQQNVEAEYKPQGGDMYLEGASNGATSTLAGFPIYYRSAPSVRPTTPFTFELWDSLGVTVPFYNADDIIYPEKPLKYGETYTVKVSFKDDKNQVITDSWIFTTKGGTNQTPPVDTKPVFDDYASGMYWSDSMLWGIDKGLIAGYQGTSDNLYLLKPYDQLTEAQLLTIMFRFLDPQKLYSLQSGNTNFFAEGAYKIALSKGLPVDKAKASQPITRGYMAQLLASAHFNKEVSVRDAVQFMYDAGLSNGFSPTEKTYDTYGVNDILLRGQVASFFMKYDEFFK